MKLSSLKVDAAAIEDGEWIGNIPEMGDLEVRVRGLNNAKYRRLQTTLIDAVPRAKRQGGRLDPDEQDRITASCLTATVLLDWRGLEGEDGQPVPYSKDLATDLLSKPEFRRFREAVIWAAAQVGEERAAADEEDAGNSQAA